MKKTLFCMLIAALQSLTVQGDCVVGRTNIMEMMPSNRTPNPEPGVYIDPSSPASCSGQITKWSFCYHYNSGRGTGPGTFPIGLQVWRINSSEGMRISESIVSIEVMNLVNFQCADKELSPDKYINITEGDVLAVRQISEGNSNAEISAVVNTEEPNTLMYLPVLPFIPTKFSSSDSQVEFRSTNAILISATVTVSEMISPPTFSPSQGRTNPAMEVTTMSDNNNSTNASVPGERTGLSLGVIIGIMVVIVFLLIIAITVLITIIILCLNKRQKMKKNSDVSSIAIDNAVYDQPDRGAQKPYKNGCYNASQASSYEIPVNNSKQSTRLQGQPSRGNTLDRGFNDSIEAQPQASRNGKVHGFSANGFNPYATLTPVDLEHYKTYLEQAASEVYATPADALSAESPYEEPPSNEVDIYKDLSKRTRTINRDQIKIHDQIGEGAFSTVSKGLWIGGETQYDVAIKALIHNSSEIDKIKLLQEAAIMGQFQHPNIVKLHGVIKVGNLPMIVTEFLHKGDLLNALNNLKPDSPGQLVEAGTPQLLLSYCQQVSLGMHYLSSKGFVHRDLAARNIFVTKDNICKVGDFGMSRELCDTDYYVSHGGVVPVRWTAPEAIFYRKYSTASDVWSYGCLLYEIWTLGMRPYEGIATKKYLDTLQVGYRLPPPPGCPRAIYSIMIMSWNPTSNQRPIFGDILAHLLKDKDEMLLIPKEDAITHHDACVLGGSLEAGLEMYKDLQDTYLKEKSKSKQRHHCLTMDKVDANHKGQIAPNVNNGSKSLPSALIRNQYEWEEDGTNSQDSVKPLKNVVYEAIAEKDNVYSSVDDANGQKDHKYYEAL